MFFLELSCFFDDPKDVGNLISGSSAFSKSSLNIWKFLVHVLLKPSLENFEHYFVNIAISIPASQDRYLSLQGSRNHKIKKKKKNTSSQSNLFSWRIEGKNNPEWKTKVP